jgi:hypothetical protein
VALDPGVDVSPEALAAAWDSDDEARAVGSAAVIRQSGLIFRLTWWRW